MIRKGSLATEELLQMLFREPDPKVLFSRYEKDFEVPAFHDYITDWAARRGERPAVIIARTDIDKSYGHQIFTGRRNPSRDTVLQLAIALEADVAETQELLRIARRSALYPRIRRDALIIHGLSRHLSLVDINILLSDAGLAILGELRHD